MTRCNKCGLQFQCICEDIPKLSCNIPLSLLMHENEYQRETNTGKWLLESLPECRDYQWSRVEANSALVERINSPQYLSLLIYPSEESISMDKAIEIARQENKTPHCIILDGTWQEAKKMERKSPWLEGIQRVHLSPEQLSCYQLRRNQSEGHLCTLEVAGELLKAQGFESEAEQLNYFLDYFSRVFHADKSGHRYQGNEVKGFGAPK